MTDATQAGTAVQKALAKARMSPGAAAAAAGLVALAGFAAPAEALTVLDDLTVTTDVTGSADMQSFAYTISNNSSETFAQIVIPETQLGAFNLSSGGAVPGLPFGWYESERTSAPINISFNANGGLYSGTAAGYVVLYDYNPDTFLRLGGSETFTLYSSLPGATNAQIAANDGSSGTAYFADPPTPMAAADAPEAATGGLLAAGMIALARLRRRRRA